jgi:hypothetical protein
MAVRECGKLSRQSLGTPRHARERLEVVSRLVPFRITRVASIRRQPLKGRRTGTGRIRACAEAVLGSKTQGFSFG